MRSKLPGPHVRAARSGRTGMQVPGHFAFAGAPDRGSWRKTQTVPAWSVGSDRPGKPSGGAGS